uniref:40S ribosomal protein S15 n=1 Tax=Glossina pallidipes TaxID=7398 RepID=A0A1A9ZYM2_GLOPL
MPRIDYQNEEVVKKKRAFKKFTYRGVDLDQLLDMPNNQLVELMHTRARRRFSRGLKRKPMALIRKLRSSTGSIIGVCNGKDFGQVEIKPEMIDHYLGECSLTYKPVKHGRSGIGATHSSRFIPLK